MRRAVTCLLLATLLDVAVDARLTVKKCCPMGQSLDASLECKEVDYKTDKRFKFKYDTSNRTGSSNEYEVHSGVLEDRLPWFPLDAVLNATDLEPLKNLAELDGVLSDSDVSYGNLPDCSDWDMDTACFTQGGTSQFWLLSYPNGDIRLYVAKRSSYHDDGYFQVEEGSCGTARNAPRPKDGDGVPVLPEGDDAFGLDRFDLATLRTFPLEDVCLDRGLDQFYIVYCPCKTTSCIRKCCSDSEVYDDVTGNCTRNDYYPHWRPDLQNSSLTRNYYLMSGTYPSSCESPHILKIPLIADADTQRECYIPGHVTERNTFQFLEDGSVKIKKYSFPLSSAAYCGEHTLHDGDKVVENNLFLCISPLDIRPVKFDIYGVMLLLGGIVLLITVAVSLYLPELRTSVYYKIIICHNFSLMIASFTWGTVNLLSSVSYSVCVFVSLVIQFTFLGSFFWMNIMCIDISLAFRRVRAASGTTVRNGNRFIWYSLYAWGAPTLITCATAAVEFAPYVPFPHLRPGFGCHNCGFNSETAAILIYFYGPMIVILLFNLVLFILTVIRIFQIQSETAILNNKGGLKKSSAFNSDKQRLVLFSKLFLLMGLTWSMEIVSWAVGGPSYYWYIPDIVNFLRAFFIFVIFICKRTVLCSLLTKLGMDEWAEVFSERKISAASSRVSETSVGRNRRSRNSTSDRNDRCDAVEIERRGRILQKQITQTIRNSDESPL